ncbi:hypothetical protein COU62_02080 [Candidatus Pacearchaeota archaeon CG10_big_fil_rev_8_21_14_0_10_35_219]|nr:hypothetical protein [Candidatus Pacearchaeota archaeon]PIO07981.1 MAG: hypothetical protein COU62_02080 [Candidatus Pacearchaeota archaeon CG10_big_fil_rev_8_21_14_0_10_35_219]PIY81435.1 MAG: hypothetical protein COY79_02885 [Candidatus Pacearchaeota archaeon CG_4_10_14_0_8_um_filter_35_169]PIZ80601.1 MAG: hypothetical protein COY00_00560 [Candidatus Pacearchaeota archaeon CG_4_10_14_0_2_um_filter_35_33]PJA70098.1 MAG: hypothetical protein CO155_01525 [Candidatus Pacearchaeota archaeon CG_4
MRDTYKFPVKLARARISYKEPGESNYRLPSHQRLAEIERELIMILKDEKFMEEINEEIRRDA